MFSKVVFSLQYNGKNYYGFQKQTNKFITIQSELEKAFFTIFQKKVTIYPAGRTDSKVHAVGQVFHITISNKVIQEKSQLFQKQKIVSFLNAILPKDIRITNFQIMHNSFHARYSCISREYLYIVYNHSIASCFFQEYSLWIKQPLDIAKMQEACQYMIGQHDFSSFTKNIYKNTNVTLLRNIEIITIKNQYPFIIFFVKGRSFLHNMIRIMVGTLLEVGLLKRKPQDIKTIIANLDRKKAGKTLPPHALFFYKAHYKEYQYDYPQNTFIDIILKE